MLFASLELPRAIVARSQLGAGLRLAALGKARQFVSSHATTSTTNDAPLVPVALNSGLYWGKGFSNFAPGCITLSILPPIAAGQSMREALGQLEAAIEGEVARLTATSPQNDSLSHQEPDA